MKHSNINFSRWMGVCFFFLALTVLVPCAIAQTEGEEEEELPTISVAEIIDIIESRCPCVDIEESEEEEAAEELEDDSNDEIEDKAKGFCTSRLFNPGKFKQGARYLADLGILQLEEGESLKDVFSALKEARKDCRKGGNKGNKGNKNGNGNGNGGDDTDDSDSTD